jgi:glutaminyl-tRNA synthetase
VTSERPSNFITELIDEDLRTGRYRRVVTRFPPEPNGYPHIGHAKSICVNFGLAEAYGGVCNLRMDDTNPETEDMEYVGAFQRDVRWLGFDWGDRMFYASDYFGQLHDHAVGLIERGLAYVDSASEDEIRAHRGSLSEPGRPTPGRARGVEENLDLFRRMRAGEFADGAHVLRARIDLAAANMKLRDPLLYRIRHAKHYRTGDAWCIYPMYDYAHPLSDAIEGITHSICTLEFENNRDLYDWVLEACRTEARPRQIEMARLAVGYTVMSKRKLLRLVQGGLVDGWDDPRMPTISGMRRRGVAPAALRAFCDRIGVAKANSMVDVGKLEFAIRDEANASTPRTMAVLRPLTLTVAGKPELGELAIERSDFEEAPPPGYKRLAPGRTVRLRHAGFVRCDEVVRDAAGAVIALRGAAVEDGPADAGVIHWVARATAVPATVRLYDRLFRVERPDDATDFEAILDPRSLEVVEGALVAPEVAAAAPGTRYQFERVGYVVVDPSSTPAAPVLNRTIGLRDTWAKEATPAAPATPEPPRAKSKKAETRPKLMSPAEMRAKARERDPALAAAHQALAAELTAEAADLLSGSAPVAAMARAAIAAGPTKAVATFLVNLGELEALIGPSPEASGAAIGRLVAMIEGDVITLAVGKQLAPEVLRDAANPGTLVAERGLGTIGGGALEAAVDEALAGAAAEVARYRAGETKLFGVLIGQVMKRIGGKAEPAAVQRVLRQRLGG